MKGKSRLLSLVLITVIYAVCFVVIQAGLAFAAPLRFAGLRAFIGGAVLLGVVVAARQPLVPSSSQWPGLLALAMTATTITFAGMFLSPGQAGAGIASVLGNVQPLLTVSLAALFLQERLTRRKILALLLGMAGIILIASPAFVGAEANSVWGMALALAASGGSAAGNLIFKAMRTQRNVLTITAWQLLIGSLPLFALSLVTERNADIIWTSDFVMLLLFLAVAGTSFPTVLWYELVQHEEVGRLTLSLFLVPVLGLGLAFLAFGESIDLLKGLGAVSTLIGVGLSLRDRRT